MLILVGMYNNIRQATTHNGVEMFFKHFVLIFPGDTARSLHTFLTTTNNLKLTNIIGGRSRAIRIIKDT